MVDINTLGNSVSFGTGATTKTGNHGCSSRTRGIDAGDQPGTNVIDHYYALEEAIKVSKPKLVVMETYQVHAK